MYKSYRNRSRELCLLEGTHLTLGGSPLEFTSLCCCPSSNSTAWPFIGWTSRIASTWGSTWIQFQNWQSCIVTRFLPSLGRTDLLKQIWCHSIGFKLVSRFTLRYSLWLLQPQMRWGLCLNDPIPSYESLWDLHPVFYIFLITHPLIEVEAEDVRVHQKSSGFLILILNS